MRGWRRESISARSSSTRSALDPADRRVYTDGQCRPPQNGRPFLCPEDIMSQPLMPHATASWLVDNTALTFEQIADFCGLHILEVQRSEEHTSELQSLMRLSYSVVCLHK